MDVSKFRDQYQHEIAGRRMALGTRAFADMVLENHPLTGKRHIVGKALDALMTRDTRRQL